MCLFSLVITEQFEWISADPKSKHEFDIHSSIHTGDFSVESRPAGDEAWMRAVEYKNPRDLDYDVTDVQVPSFNNYMPQTLRREAYHEIVQYPWRYYFSDVHSIPKIAFQQILPENFCRKRQNTFWLALSLALTGGDRFCRFSPVQFLLRWLIPSTQGPSSRPMLDTTTMKSRSCPIILDMTHTLP